VKLLTKAVPLLLVILLGGAPGVGAQGQFVPPWGPDLAPRWAPVPQVPGVYYVPNFGHDLFRYGNRFYYYRDGLWHRGDHLNGPWKTMKNPPRPFYNIGPTYFKSPPGWAKGKKTGWRGETQPPGHMKKMGQGGGLPPGQMKKLEQGEPLPPGQMKKYE
jgi:hypothetical protein